MLHRNGIIPYVAFCVWLLSLSIMFQGSSMLKHVSEFPFYDISHFPLNDIPLWGETTFVYPFISLELLWIVLMWTFTPRCLYGYMVSFLLGIPGSMKLLGPVVTPHLTPNIPRCSLKTPESHFPQPLAQSLGLLPTISPRLTRQSPLFHRPSPSWIKTGMASLTRMTWGTPLLLLVRRPAPPPSTS